MKHLNLFGPVTTRTGYGIFVLNLARQFNKNTRVCLVPRSLIQEAELANDMEVRQMCDRGREEFDYNAPSLNIWHAHNMQCFHSAERIGFPIFEGTKFSSCEKLHLSHLDRIAVTSEWAKAIVVENLGKNFDPSRVIIINGGIDPEIFNAQPSISIPAIDQFTGTKAISVGKWEVRKGQADIIKALADIRPDLTMFGMWDNPFWPGWKEFCMNILHDTGWSPTDNQKAVWKIGANTYLALVGWVQNHVQYSEILRKMDFGVFPYRAEGWCLPLHEAMACGLPVVATNYSAPTEFLTEDCGILIDGSMEPIYDQIHFPNGGYGDWMVPSHEQLCEAILDMMDYDWKYTGALAAKQAHKFTWEESVKKARKQLW